MKKRKLQWHAEIKLYFTLGYILSELYLIAVLRQNNFDKKKDDRWKYSILLYFAPMILGIMIYIYYKYIYICVYIFFINLEHLLRSEINVDLILSMKFFALIYGHIYDNEFSIFSVSFIFNTNS